MVGLGVHRLRPNGGSGHRHVLVHPCFFTAITGFTKFIFTALQIRLSKLRYFHCTPADQRPAMQVKREAERAELLEQMP